MKHLLLSIFVTLGILSSVQAADYKSMTWAQICSGNMGDSWYASAEAVSVADTVLAVQKTNGGWMKNDQLHKLSTTELNALKAARGEHSCLDNYATTQEMRFLARVYRGTKDERYRTAFTKALNMIIAAEFKNGGWGQYWPLTDDRWSYQNYITFNDDLTINALKMMRDVYENKGLFENMTDEATRKKCRETFDRGVEMIIRCQIDDNGTKAAWCAQHDPNDLLPTEGRPHELPSVSGYESSAILSFLMSIEEPSAELQECITSAIQWLDAHKIPGKAVEDYTNANGEKDRRIIDKEGSALWGRFIQIGGASGEKIYNKLFKKLQDRGKSRSYTTGGVTYSYTEYEIAKASYNPEMAYQPIYAIYKNELAHLFYRFLYNYADSDPVVDSKGCPVATSLMATNRVSYQYVGSWCQHTINSEYPAWKKRIEALNAAGDATAYELNQSTYTQDVTSGDSHTYKFNNGFAISNAKGKAYGAGKEGGIKYSANVPYTILIPNDLMVTKAAFNGYDNYDAEACITAFNGKNYSSSTYPFPAKEGDQYTIASHTLDISDNPASGSVVFQLGAKQCVLSIILYCIEPNGLNSVTTNARPSTTKRIENGQIVIVRNGIKYNILGQEI